MFAVVRLGVPEGHQSLRLAFGFLMNFMLGLGLLLLLDMDRILV